MWNWAFKRRCLLASSTIPIPCGVKPLWQIPAWCISHLKYVTLLNCSRNPMSVFSRPLIFGWFLMRPYENVTPWPRRRHEVWYGWFMYPPKINTLTLSIPKQAVSQTLPYCRGRTWRHRKASNCDVITSGENGLEKKTEWSNFLSTLQKKKLVVLERTS